MRKFNWRIFKNITVIPLLVLKVIVLVLGFSGAVSAVVIFSIAAPLSFAVTIIAIIQGLKVVPGKDYFEEMRYVIRPHTVVILKDFFEQKDRTVAVLHEYVEHNAKPDIRKVYLVGKKDHQLLKDKMVKEKNYRIGKNYELFE